MDERRREPRSRSLLSGMITFNENQGTMDCAVRNISPHGALVVSSELFRMAGEFGLAIPHRDERHRAAIAWRRGDNAGVTLSPVEPATERKRAAPRLMLQGSRRPVKKGVVLGY